MEKPHLKVKITLKYETDYSQLTNFLISSLKQQRTNLWDSLESVVTSYAIHLWPFAIVIY